MQKKNIYDFEWLKGPLSLIFGLRAAPNQTLARKNFFTQNQGFSGVMLKAVNSKRFKRYRKFRENADLFI